MTTTAVRNGRLHVSGRPSLVLGAELHNSSASTTSAIRRSFAKVRDLGADTVLAPVSWALVEPEEGHFDHTLLDEMLATARELGLRLVPLWFGSWKNGMSSYVPAWVKRDPVRFPRAETSRSRIEHLSPFVERNRDADAAAFVAVMSHLAEVDQDGTVIMVQVENEVGLLGDSRDRSPAAENAYRSAVPAAVLDAVRAEEAGPLRELWTRAGGASSGTWSDVLGEGPATDEVFMAAAYAGYIGHVAARGRAAHDVPLFVNAWLDNPPEALPATMRGEGTTVEDGDGEVALAGGQQPGDYPSGGPLSHVAPIWRALAPALDFLAPDIYFGFDDICRRFRAASGVLFIPEMRRDQEGVAQMFAAVGEHRALGVSPFGVDSFTEAEGEQWAALADAYRLLAAAGEALADAPGSMTRGFRLNAERPETDLDFDRFRFSIGTADPFGLATPTYPAYGLVAQLGEDRFLVVGRGFSVSVSSREEGRLAGILSADELDWDGTWRVLRRLGGDETGSGASVRFPALGQGQVTAFPIPFNLELSGIVQVELYEY